MKTSILSFISFSLLCIMTLAGCSEDKTELLPEPTLSVSERTLSFGFEEDKQEVAVTTNQAKWFVVMDSKDKRWCIVYSNNNKMSIRVETNPKEEKREAKILVIVAGSLMDSIEVFQEAAPPVPILKVSGETSFTFEEASGSHAKIVSVITNQADWSASVDPANSSWCSIEENKVDNTIAISVEENLDKERFATITVTGGLATPVVFEVLQEGRDATEAIGVDLPTFENSFIYSVMSDGEKIAEICDEYIKEVSSTKRTTVAYPFVDGKVDLTRGFITDNGGRIAWNKENGTYDYSPGGLTSITKLYISGSVIRATGLAVKTATTEPEKLNDIEGNSYKLVKVGLQYWTAENLKTITYNDNTPIPGLIGIEDKKGGYLIYEDQQFVADKNYRGCLYNFFALPKLAPKGWHVPAQHEWEKLGNYIFGTTGLLMKENEWEMSYPGMNATGFSAIPSGYCFETGKCTYGGNLSAWWSTTEDSNNVKQAYYGQADLLGKFSSNNSYAKRSGYAVRLLRD